MSGCDGPEVIRFSARLTRDQKVETAYGDKSHTKCREQEADRGSPCPKVHGGLMALPKRAYESQCGWFSNVDFLRICSQGYLEKQALAEAMHSPMGSAKTTILER